jgi:flagellar biosynthesis/type III secretory pathway protein FliH
MLRQAVNHGYEEGFRAGKADRDDRWRGNYKDSYAYRDANYGYSGYYVDRSDYNYYFREGFRRGYEDGYNSRYRYGRNSGGNYSMLDNILSQILNFQALR